MRWGLLADIHGNRWALEAVFEDAVQRSIDQWINLGDCFYGPLDPAGTAKCLRHLDATTVRGNQDRVLVSLPEGASGLPTHRFVMESLSALDLEWLASLPVSAVVDGVYLCHGTPQSDEAPLLEEIRQAGVSLRAEASIAQALAAVTEPVVACAHTHVPRLVQLANGSLVINPGSVGLPAYTDDAPYPHAMEAGSPHARYAVLEQCSDGWKVEQLAVPYDWQAAALQAERQGRPDWAEWLRTGRASAVSGER